MGSLELVRVTYGYARLQPILRSVSLRVRRGEAVIITGPNGAGKSTLLRIAGLVVKPWSGRVLVDGVDYWGEGEPLEARRAVGYAPPNPVILRGSVELNIAVGLLIRGWRVEEALREARRLLMAVGAAGLADRDARRLSSGERHLVTVLRVIAVAPRYLVLDEPTAYLDSRRRERLARLLAELVEEGHGLLVATHDALLASRLGGKVLAMENGVLRRGALVATGGG